MWISKLPLLFEPLEQKFMSTKLRLLVHALWYVLHYSAAAEILITTSTPGVPRKSLFPPYPNIPAQICLPTQNFISSCLSQNAMGILTSIRENFDKQSRTWSVIDSGRTTRHRSVPILNLFGRYALFLIYVPHSAVPQAKLLLHSS